MSGDGTTGGEEPLVRPFLGRGAGKLPGQEAGRPDLRGEVRPYLLTGGRTTTDVQLAMESVVAATGVAPGRLPTLEHEAVYSDCTRPRSVAEISARRRIPLRVALVLVGDLVGAGLLEAATTTASQSDDVHFLERLINGVSAL